MEAAAPAPPTAAARASPGSTCAHSCCATACSRPSRSRRRSPSRSRRAPASARSSSSAAALERPTSPARSRSSTGSSTSISRGEVDQAAAGLLSEQLAHRYGALPVRFLDEETILVAVADPTNVLFSDDLRLALGLNVRIGVAARDEHRAACSAASTARSVEIHRGGAVRRRPQSWPRPARPRSSSSTSSSPGRSTRAPPTSTSSRRPRGVKVRARIDGVMRDMASMPGDLQAARHEPPQDHGRARHRRPARATGRPGLDPASAACRRPPDRRPADDLRRAGRAADHAPRRRPPRSGGARHVADRGGDLCARDRPAVRRRARRAGRPERARRRRCTRRSSSSTTTDRVLTTIEDPVEYQLPGVTQIEVNAEAGLTFARGLRTILRCDPDVILVGEIRDEETAQIAIQAAMTGHLVLTIAAMHNAASSLPRLLDIDVEPGCSRPRSTASSPSGSHAASAWSAAEPYRRARRICDDRGLRARGPRSTARRAARIARGTGFAGRVALYEVLPVIGPIRRLIEASTEEIVAAAVEMGMRTLRQDGIRLCLAGVSSLDEIRRVTGDRAELELADPGGVLLAVRAQRAGELVVAVRLGVDALQLERTTERVVGEVVGRRELEDLPELGGRLVAAGAGGGTRSRAPRGSTPSPARAASPSRARPSPARPCRCGGVACPAGRARTRRSSRREQPLDLVEDRGGDDRLRGPAATDGRRPRRRATTSFSGASKPIPGSETSL